MGTWPIYKKHFLQLILTKKNFHLIKYLLVTFIFVLSFQFVLVSLVPGHIKSLITLLSFQPTSLVAKAAGIWCGWPRAEVATRHFDMSLYY